MPGSEWRGIRAAWESSRHAVSRVDGVFVAGNPGQGWQARFEDGGVLIRPAAAGWSWGLRLVRYGFLGQQREAVGPSRTTAQGGRLCYRWDEDLDEWYINDRRGLEHGYTVHQRPVREAAGADGPLVLTLAVRGGLSAAIGEDQRSARFLDDAGNEVLSYSGLIAFDADGRDLPARLEWRGGRLLLLVEERGARYPLTIDPVVQQAYLKASNAEAGDGFGYSVSISGDTAVVGAPMEDGPGSAGNQGNGSSSAGAAYVFVRSNSQWRQQAYLKASNSDPTDLFGFCVSISGDTIVVGAPYEDSNATGVNGPQVNHGAGLQSGAAYVFVRSGTSWTQQAYLKASNTRADTRFGISLAISADTVVVGSHRESTSGYHSGAAYVFVRSAQGGWSQQAQLKALNADPIDNFGYCVAVSGDLIAVGAPYEDSNATGVNGSNYNNSAAQSGAAYAFVRSGSSWSQEAYFKASNTGAGDLFGGFVAVSADTLIVGAFREDSAATGINGDQTDNGASDSGAAYAFVRSAGQWAQQAYLKASNTGAGDYFGVSLAIAGDKVLVGAPNEDSDARGVNGNGGNNLARDSGAAYGFERAGGVWVQTLYLKARVSESADSFGAAVSTSVNTQLVGARQEDSKATGVNGDESDNSASDAGAAYVFDANCRRSATATRVGVGCAASGVAPLLDSDPPVQGKPCRWLVSSLLPNVAGVVLVGIPHAGIPLGSGCTAYFDLTLPTIPVFFATNPTGGWLSPPFMVGTSQRIMCSEVGLQAALYDPGTAPLGMALSNGVRATIGN